MSDKPDWTTAPLDAQFHSFGLFRKHDNGNEFYYDRNHWSETDFDGMDFHEEQCDFEIRPESSKPEWDGKGLPPVGTVCEHHSGRKYEVAGYANQETEQHEAYPLTIIYCNIETGSSWCKPFEEWKKSFKPAKSDRDKWVDTTIKHLKDHYGWMRVDSMTSEAIEDIYDALKSGKLPTP